MVMPDKNTQTMAASGAGAADGRRPTVVPAPEAANPELSEPGRRRRFTAQDKRRILQAVDRASGSGEIGAILRREGLYSSALTVWRRQRDAGALDGLTPLRRGPKASQTNPLQAELAKTKQENLRLRLRLDRAEAIIDLQKKVSDLLGRTRPAIETDDTR